MMSDVCRPWVPLVAAAALAVSAACSAGGTAAAGSDGGDDGRGRDHAHPVQATERDWAAFARYPGGETLLMGDLVVTERELPKVTDALQARGIAQTALHKHLLDERPAVWWTHIHGVGDAAELARGVRAALDETSTPPPKKGLAGAGPSGAAGGRGLTALRVAVAHPSCPTYSPYSTCQGSSAHRTDGRSHAST